MATNQDNMPVKRNLLRGVIIALLVLIALGALVINLIYQLNYGVLSSVPYKLYILKAVNSLLLLIGAYAAYRISVFLVARTFFQRTGAGGLEAIDTILKIIFYVVAIALILVSFGVSPASALAGGAIGGVVLGLAVQTIATNILSGFFVSSTRVLKVGDVVTINTGAWGAINPLVWGEISCTVSKIGMLWTTLVNQYGNTMLMPNSNLLGNILWTKLKSSDGLRYVKLVTVNADVPGSKIKAIAAEELSKGFSKLKLKSPEIRHSSKLGSTNTFSVIIHFEKFSELNELIDIVNQAFDDAYWKAKG
jgi:small-conductance mechanosensitive channel